MYPARTEYSNVYSSYIVLKCICSASIIKRNKTEMLVSYAIMLFCVHVLRMITVNLQPRPWRNSMLKHKQLKLAIFVLMFFSFWSRKHIELVAIQKLNWAEARYLS